MPQPHLPPHNPPNPTAHNPPTSLNPTNLLTTLSLLLLITPPRRRLPRFRNMSFPNPRNPSNPRNPNSLISFPTPQSLSEWLKPRLPSESFSTWGAKPGTKNVHNLWLELADGETSLVDSVPPLRNLEVVSVRIKRIVGGVEVCLVEDYQELCDGTVRERGRPLSEKMKAGESVEDAVKRGVMEELGSVIGGEDGGEKIKVVEGSYVRKVEERVSDSYPGLPGYYVFHTVEAVVEGLPEGEFETEEGDEYAAVEDGDGVASGAVKVKKHFWKWVPVDDV